MTLPHDFVMKEMAKIAIEQATEMFAVMALKFSETIPADISGREALQAFAATIRKTNAEAYQSGKGAA